MPTIRFLPHEEICPTEQVVEVEPGVSICDAARWICDAACPAASRSNMPARSPARARPAMSMSGKGATR